MNPPLVTRGLYVNLPVADLARSRAFYAGLGFEIDPRFSDDNAVAVVLGPHQVVMLLRRAFFQTFTERGICDAQRELQCLIAIQLASREGVDAIVEAAIAHGGSEAHEAEDHGFMYQRAFHDPDGHGWGPFWMDPAGIPAQD